MDLNDLPEEPVKKKDMWNVLLGVVFGLIWMTIVVAPQIRYNLASPVTLFLIAFVPMGGLAGYGTSTKFTIITGVAMCLLLLAINYYIFLMCFATAGFNTSRC